MRRFSEEVLLHSQQRHPNIVQLIGVHYPRGSQLPMLVMEYLPFSLTQCLEREDVEEGMPLQMKYSILLDVAKGLCYLHGKSPPIVHRDLTANNVLLTSSYTAKISDLGVSRLADTFRTHEPLTTAPGNAIVMPPEAITDKPVYNHKLDVFTYGCLIIHILTREFPAPTDAYKRQVFLRQKKVPECDRRLKYIQKIPKENEILPLAKQCLDDDPNRRPDMIEAFRFVEQVLERYPKNNLLELIQKNKLTKEVLDQYITMYNTDVVAKEDEITDFKRKQEEFYVEIARKESKIESSKREMREMSLIIQEKEANMRNLQELASELKANVIAKEDEIKNHKKEMREMSLKKEANIRNLQKLASELKANVIAKEDEIENRKKELKDVRSRLEKLLQDKRRQESQKTCLGRGVEALEAILYDLCSSGLLNKVRKFCCQRSRNVLKFHQRWKNLFMIALLIFVVVCVMWNWNDLVSWDKVKVFFDIFFAFCCLLFVVTFILI